MNAAIVGTVSLETPLEAGLVRRLLNLDGEMSTMQCRQTVLNIDLNHNRAIFACYNKLHINVWFFPSLDKTTCSTCCAVPYETFG